MTETTQEERKIWKIWDILSKQKYLRKVDAPKFVNKLVNDADRLARIEAACLLRSEIDAPEWATRWYKHPEWGCVFVDADLYPTPDYRPDTDGPVTLPIVEA